MALTIVGDLHLSSSQFSRLRSLVSQVDICPSKDPNTLLGSLRKSQYAFACNVNLTPFLQHLGHLDLLIMAETGLANLDPTLARSHGINFTNLPSYSAGAVTQYVLRCMFESIRPWEAVFGPLAAVSRADKMGRDLEDHVVGIVGLGVIGRKVADALGSLARQVIFTKRRPVRHPSAKWVSLSTVFSISDIVVLCCPKNQDSIGMINWDLLSRLKKKSTVISISPNEVFDRNDLLSFVQQRPDVTFWLDWDHDEPYETLRQYPQVHLSPHLAFFTDRSLHNRIEECINRLEDFLNYGATKPSEDSLPHLHIEQIEEALGEETPEEKVLRIGSQFYQSASLYAALELNLFDKLECPRSVDELSNALSTNRDMLNGLLESLRSSQLLVKTNDGRYSLPKALQPVLSGKSSSYFGDPILVLKNRVCPAWLKLSQAVKTGRPLEALQQSRSADATSADKLTRGSNAQSRSIASRALPNLSVKQGAKILDIGCGSAFITRALLKKDPTAKAVLLDVPTVIEVLKNEYLINDELSARCELIASDYHKAFPQNSDFDLVLLSNVIHMEHPAGMSELFLKCHDALSPGGTIAIIGFFPPSSEPIDFLLPHFSLSCQLLTEGGRCYSHDEATGCLYDSGFSKVKRVFLTRYVDLLLATRNTQLC